MESEAQKTVGQEPQLVGDRRLLEQDVIAKVNAGAQLTFAIWSLRKDVMNALLRDAPAAFANAYAKACDAYGVSH